MAVADFHAAEPPVTAGPTGSARMAAVHDINERELAAGSERFVRAGTLARTLSSKTAQPAASPCERASQARLAASVAA